MARDYKAEYARRQQLARERGYGSYGRQRGKIQRGEIRALAPNRIRSERTRQAQREFLERAREVAEGEKGFDQLVEEFTSVLTDEQRAAQWSAGFARSEIAQYKPEEAESLGISRDEYTQAYLDAFVEGPSRYADVRYDGGSDALEFWFVELHEYFEVDEYDKRYGSD